jgi:hypothetical protein
MDADLRPFIERALLLSGHWRAVEALAAESGIRNTPIRNIDC